MVKVGSGGTDDGGEMPRFTFRLEQVLEHRSRREDLMRQELAQAMAAVAVQQERAVAAEAQVDAGLAGLRELMGSPSELAALRSAHADLAILRARAVHEQATVAGLGQVADERRADLVRASQDREAIDQLRARALERHAVEGARQEAIVMDELAMRRASRPRPGMAA